MMSGTLVELAPEQFHVVRQLAKTMSLHSFCTAVVAGVTPGRIFVDDVVNPTLVFVSREGPWCFLFGDPGDGAWYPRLREGLMCGEMIKAGSILLTCQPEGWDGVVSELFPDRTPIQIRRRHYVLTSREFRWRPRVPDGIEIRRMDDSLLDSERVTLPDEVRETLGRWRAAEAPDFADYGFVAVDSTVSPAQVASWATVDSVVEGVGDAGIFTLPPYRGRGLASAAAGAAVAHGFSLGLSAIYWTCTETNAPSIHIAEKLGFKRQRDYTLIYVHRDEILHLGAMGYAELEAGHPEKALGLLQQALAARDGLPSFIAFDAARASAQVGDTELALTYLEIAVDHGWRSVEEMESCADFATLRDQPAWGDLVSRMRGG